MSPKTQRIAEQCALAIVVLFPLTAILWYVFYGSAPAASTPAPITTPAATQASVQPVQPVQPVQVAAPSGIVTLDNATALPVTVTAAQVVPFSFAIKNTGSSVASFPYKVYVKWDSGEEDVLDENSVSLAAGASIDIPEALKFETATAKGQVYIVLQPSIDTIHFSMPRV
jgi:hypothetical protein